MTKLYFATIISLFLYASAISQDRISNKNPWHNDIKINLYSCNFKTTKNRIDKGLIKDPEDIFLIRLQNHYDFLKIQFFENKRCTDTWFSEIDNRIKIIESSNSEEYIKAYILSETYIYSTIINIECNNEISALKNFRKGFEQYKLLEKLAPEFPGTIKIRGIYNIFIGSIPEKYNWLSSSIGIKGNYELGVKSLKSSYYNSINIGDYYENGLYYSLFAAYISDNPKKEYYTFKSQNDSIFNNPIMRQGLSILARAAGETNECLSVLNNHYNDQGDTYFSLLDFQIGEFMLYQLNPDAKIYLNKFLKNYQGKNIRSLTHQYLFWNYSIHKNPIEAQNHRAQAIKTAKKFPSEKSNQIISELKSNHIETSLLKARLLFDGGNYEQANNELNSFTSTITQNKDITEYYYRKGRILKKLGKSSSAIKYYKKALISGKDNRWYFAPKSALELGDIYKSNNKYKEAKMYYHLCLKINNGEYKESINRQAKEKLSKLSKKKG